MREAIDTIYRAESRRVLATLIRLLGDFDRAEEATQAAFAAALQQWPREGVPASPRAWLVSVGRFRAIDALRRRARFDASLGRLAEQIAAEAAQDEALARQGGGAPGLEGRDLERRDVEDDALRLIFTCCHPALSPEARLALTLREVCGLTTEEVARACLVRPPTLAQRIVRAKAKLRDEQIPYELPSHAALPERLEVVLRVIYLMFNEGYSASSGEALLRPDLSAEAVRLGRLLVALLPEPEAQGLLALMLLLDARRAARTTTSGDVVLIDDQDRALWDVTQIAEGAGLVEAALRSRRVGPYALQAAIAAVHAESESPEATDWPQIAGLYAVLLRVEPSPVIALNRAVAVSMCEGPGEGPSAGPRAGLALVDALLAKGELQDYMPAHATRADLCRRLGLREEARASYVLALNCARQEPERRFLMGRLAELEEGAGSG